MKKSRKTAAYGTSALQLHGSLLISSLSGICSKMAARQPAFSLPFFLWYGGTLAIMFVYALVWQQILKRMPTDGGVCQSSGESDLGNALGKSDFSGKDHLEYDSGCRRNLRGDLPGGDSG